MANIKSQIKRNKTNEKARERNKAATDNRRYQNRSPNGRGQSIEQGCSIPYAAAVPAGA